MGHANDQGSPGARAQGKGLSVQLPPLRFDRIAAAGAVEHRGGGGGSDDDDDDVIIMPADASQPPPLPDAPARTGGAYTPAPPRYQSWLTVVRRAPASNARVHVELSHGVLQVRSNAQSRDADQSFDLSRCRLGAARSNELQFCIETATGSALFAADTVESYVAWMTVLRSVLGRKL